MTNNQNQDQPQQQGENPISEYFDGVKQLEMQGYETGIKKARNALFVTAGLVFLGEMISIGTSGGDFTGLAIGIALIEAGIFVALGFWTKTKPFTAIIIGLVLFILLWILAIVIVGGRAAYGGIIIRVIIIVYLASALKPARAWEMLKRDTRQ